MQVIRQGVFETNSSSTHSICIVGGTFIPDIRKMLNIIKTPHLHT